MSKQWSVPRHGWTLRLRVIQFFLSPSISNACPLSDFILGRASPPTPLVPGSFEAHHLYISWPLVNAHLWHLLCTRTLALICHMAISEPVTTSRRLGSCTHLESGDWQPHLKRMIAKRPERVLFSERERWNKEGAVRGSPFDLYYVYFISNKSVLFTYLMSSNIWMSTYT